MTAEPEMVRIFTTATIVGSSTDREYDFSVDTGHVYIGLPEIEIQELGLKPIPKGKVEVLTSTGTIERQTYWAMGRIAGQGFAATAIPASAPLIGHQFLENRGFRVNSVIETIERIPDDEFGPPYGVSQWPI